jgi:hypothetical protein
LAALPEIPNKLIPVNSDISLKLSRHVETVVLLRGIKTDSHISVDLDVEKLGINS